MKASFQKTGMVFSRRKYECEMRVFQKTSMNLNAKCVRMWLM